MNFLFDFFPILLFFIAFRFYDIYTATAVTIAASGLQVATFWYKHRRVEMMQILFLIFITLLGGATLIFHNEVFIKWKPTVMGWIFATVFLFTQLLGDKPLTQRMLEKNVDLPRVVWKRLNISWVVFFIMVGCANLFVVYNFNTNIWVNFKVFGILGATFIFAILQSLYVARFVEVKKREILNDNK